MLEWFTGPSRTGDAQCARADDGESYLKEPPETPAPLFAVRAFKSAIFGTPRPHQSHSHLDTEAVGQRKDTENAQHAEREENIEARDAVNDDASGHVAVVRMDSLASPTKGILLTPGTGATRRKTVSFGIVSTDPQSKAKELLSAEAGLDSPLISRPNAEVPEASLTIQPRHSSLTKTLIQLSKQVSNIQPSSDTVVQEGHSQKYSSSIGAQTQKPDQTADSTVDLSQPCSRSGQHWKTEYEQYHRRSNREMKNIIMYGQNVKSYAVKKDSEALGLSEKLKKELAKVAAMEKKVSKLAAQLNTAYAHSPEGESEQSRLVSELAQQTALAIRYKQKADRYRRALQKENDSKGSDGEGDDTEIYPEAHRGLQREPGFPEVVPQLSENGTLQAQMEILRTSAKKAEDEAAKLEAENKALKQSLARVKGEMMSYEARRQAREERLKSREEKCKADQKACEAQLAKLTVEHRNLQLASGLSSQAIALGQPQSAACDDSLKSLERVPKPSEAVLANDKATDRGSLGQNRVSKPYISPRKGRLQKSAIDIWTLSSPRDAVENVSPSKDTTELPPSSVRHDIQRTLKEIDQNLSAGQHPGTKLDPDFHITQSSCSDKTPSKAIPKHHSGMSSSPVHSTHNRKPTTISPRPVVIELTSSPAKLDPSSEATVKPAVKKAMATLGRSSSLMSRMGSRTNTMTSSRGSALPAERVAAAKARLAARSVEKRKIGG